MKHHHLSCSCEVAHLVLFLYYVNKVHISVGVVALH